MEHHQIENLAKRLDKRWEDKDRDKQTKDYLYAVDKIISEAQPQQKTQFWCGTCEKDYEALGRKIVETDWVSHSYICYFIAKCPKGHRNKRWVTDRRKDPYYKNSALIRLQRREHYKDLLQPFQTGYNMLYGNRNKNAID